MLHLLTIILTVGASTTLGAPPNGRIFGGELASPGQFPFIVHLSTSCGGTIINKNWVLTAAHCLMYVDNLTVVAGTNSLLSGGVTYNVTQYFSHEDFDITTIKNDIALIQIDGEFEFNELIQPAEYFDLEENSTCIVTGWGRTEDNDNPDDLLFVELTGLNYEVCGDVAGGTAAGAYLGPEQVCAVGPVGQGACSGDSGGPLVCDGKLAGVVSYAMVPCAEGYPDVYSKPTAYVDWINEKIQS